jgi:carboxyl-terminal processing protease
MQMKNLIIITAIIFFVSASCKEDSFVPDVAVTPDMARDSLYYIMKEWYYWYKEMPDISETEKANYKDPYELMSAMRYKPVDRWSFVADYDEFNAAMNGTFIGHGIRIGVDQAGNARIAMIYNGSPLYTDSIRRGWIVKKINGTDPAPVILSNVQTAYDDLIGPSREGITNVFVFQRPNGSLKTVTSTKVSLTINTVILYDTLHLSTGVTGHLVFDSFITPSVFELANAFAYFKANNVKDLILDLRYNSGGYLDIAQTLASYIAGNSYLSTIFLKLQYNDRHQNKNSTYMFKSTSSPLSLSRLAVITTRSTASASEAVMNGLKPVINVVSIGDTTNGKPTGMNGWDIGRKYWMYPVTFKMVNSRNQGEYYDGIVPSKYVTDDISHDFKDRNELCLKEAIRFIETGSVYPKGESEFYRGPQLSEKPGWMSNVFMK